MTDLSASAHLADRLFGLRFVSPETEAEYGQWRVGTTIPFVRVGMVASTMNWMLFLVSTQVLSPDQLPSVVPWVLGIALPPIVGTLAVSYWTRARTWLMPLTALANCIAGLVVAWLVHEVAVLDGAPGIIAAVNVMLMFFAFTIFRMTPELAIVAVAPYLGLVVFLLLGDLRSGVLSWVAFGSLVTGQAAAFVTGILVCSVLEVVTRRSFAARRIIDLQQAALEESREHIRRYVPPAVADRIIAGEAAAVDEPQRRRLTVLFSDIVGFTEMADRLDPESLTEILNQYMAAMAEIVDEHRGTLNEFAGDGLMAVFGAPVALEPEEQVWHALGAAKAMQAKLPDLNRAWLKLGIGKPLQIRIGVNTGVLSVGSFGSEGRMTYTAIGMQTNVAARIQAHCEPGELLVSGVSWELIKDRVDCEPRGEIEVKGVHYPVAVYAPRATDVAPEEG